MRKKGISAIVATVLIILITVAAVAILWGAILPLLEDIKGTSTDSAVSIDTLGGYTLYDETQKIACVQVVKKNSDEIEGLKVLFSVGGNSFSGQIEKKDVPEFNQKKTYCFSLQNFGKPDMVTVVALPDRRRLAVTSIVPISQLTFESLGSLLGGGGSPSQIRYLDLDSSVITECAVLNVPGKTYRLKNSVSTTETCFNVTADDVTLDCGSWASRIVYGDSPTTTSYFGVYSDRVNTTIRNCEITRGSLAGAGVDRYGVYLSNSNYSLIENINVSNNLAGVLIDSYSHHNLLRDITATSNFYGLYLYYSSENNISGAKVTFSGYKGLYMDSFSSFNRVISSEFSDGRESGAYIYGMDIRGSNNYFKDIKANRNRATALDTISRGVSIYLGSRNSFENIEAKENYAEGAKGRSYGVYLTTTSESSFRNLTLSNNYVTGVNGSAYGLFLYLANNNSFLDVNTSYNHCVNDCDLYTPDGGASAVGFGISSSKGNVFRNVGSAHNFHTGVYFYYGSFNNSFDNLDVSYNDNYGLSIQNAWDNNFTNVLANGMDRGVFMVNYQSTGVNSNNLFRNLSASNNNYGIYFMKISTPNNVVNTQINNSRICNNAQKDIQCGADATGIRGGLNFIGSRLTPCNDNLWPTALDYTLC